MSCPLRRRSGRTSLLPRRRRRSRASACTARSDIVPAGVRRIEVKEAAKEAKIVGRPRAEVAPQARRNSAVWATPWVGSPALEQEHAVTEVGDQDAERVGGAALVDDRGNCPVQGCPLESKLLGRPSAESGCFAAGSCQTTIGRSRAWITTASPRTSSSSKLYFFPGTSIPASPT